MSELINREFDLIAAVYNLDVSDFPGDNPFYNSEKWRILGKKALLENSLYESERSVSIWETKFQRCSKVVVRLSNYHITDITDRNTFHPKANVVLLDEPRFEESVSWEAYSIEGVWKGEWTTLAAVHAKSILEIAEREVFLGKD